VGVAYALSANLDISAAKERQKENKGGEDVTVDVVKAFI
jgi:hypothetical protein